MTVCPDCLDFIKIEDFDNHQLTEHKQTPDYQGWHDYYTEYENAGCPVDNKELMRICKIYHTPFLIFEISG